MYIQKMVLAAAAGSLMALTGCAMTDMKMGSQDAKTVATGGAAGGAATNENSELENAARLWALSRW